jgi:hypothetical protein
LRQEKGCGLGHRPDTLASIVTLNKFLKIDSRCGSDFLPRDIGLDFWRFTRAYVDEYYVEPASPNLIRHKLMLG